MNIKTTGISLQSVLLLATILFSQVSHASYLSVSGSKALNMIKVLERADLLKNGETTSLEDRTIISYKIGLVECESPTVDFYRCMVNNSPVESEENSHDLYFATTELTNIQILTEDRWWTLVGELTCVIETNKSNVKEYRCLFWEN